MKSVGKPDARNGHVRFDERGRETERLPIGAATAPFLDSTPSFALPHGENVLSKAFCKAEAMIASRLALPGHSDRKILIVQKRIGEPYVSR